MSETDYTYILAKRSRGKFYLPSIGFPLQEHLCAKKFNTNTNRGSAAKSYQEKRAWKSRRVKWLCFFLTFSVFLVSVRRKETQKFFIENNSCMELKVWTGCIVMHRTSLKTKQNHTQKLWRKTKVSSWEHESKRLFRSEASMNRTNLTIILVSGASAMLYFR